jgi:hypothetical protein
VTPTQRTRRALLLLLPVALVGLIAAGLAVVSRSSDAAFVFEQQHPSTLNPEELELLVKKAPEPRPHGPGRRADTVKCVPGSATGQRNPWACTASYPSGHRIRYRIELRRNGSYSGIDRTGQFAVRGCCVAGGTG